MGWDEMDIFKTSHEIPEGYEERQAVSKPDILFDEASDQTDDLIFSNDLIFAANAKCQLKSKYEPHTQDMGNHFRSLPVKIRLPRSKAIENPLFNDETDLLFLEDSFDFHFRPHKWEGAKTCKPSAPPMFDDDGDALDWLS